jgi:hypothetical protein
MRSSIAALGLLFAFPGVASAAETPIPPATLWQWAQQGDVAKGVIFPLLGLAGALFVAFTLVGGTVPGPAGKAQLDKDRELLDDLTAQMKDALAKGEARGGELRLAVGDLRDDYNRERLSQWIVAAILYAVLGAFFANALAQDMLHAVAIGASWTGLVGTFGLKSDFEQRKAEKDAAIDTLADTIAAATQKPRRRAGSDARRRRRVAAPPPRVAAVRERLDLTGVASIDRILDDADVARAL